MRHEAAAYFTTDTVPILLHTIRSVNAPATKVVVVGSVPELGAWYSTLSFSLLLALYLSPSLARSLSFSLSLVFSLSPLSLARSVYLSRLYIYFFIISFF